MQTYLRRGVYLCFVDEGAIFLDTLANAYVGIDVATKAALMRSLAGLAPAQNAPPPLQADLPDGVAELVRRRLLTVSRAMGHPFSPTSISMGSAIPFGTGRSQATRTHALHIVWVIVALFMASLRLRRGRLSAMIARLIALKAQISSSRSDWSELVRLVHIFRRVSLLFYTPKDACLLDSAALTEFLLRYGFNPVLVVGVRTKPFSAHAWVQADDCILNDSLEHAQTLTPIAII